MATSPYLIEPSGLDGPDLLAPWSWRLPAGLTVRALNLFGDMFLADAGGAIHHLDVGNGTLERIAGSKDDLAAKLAEEDNATVWLLVPLVDQLVEAGMVPGPDECYGYKTPPVLGGGYTVENTAVLPIVDHLGFLGKLHEKIKDLPDGAAITFEVTE